MRGLYLFFALIWWSSILHAQSFKTPVEGKYGKDFIIVNYIDWGRTKISDYKKGTKTYPGHQGTDFVISGFPQMDAGVYVNAVDSGIVTYVHDGEYDRNTVSHVELGFGNYIAIRHPSKLYSYYAHLRKNSLLVKPGDTVRAGQHIALVGSSGNSTDPHLHFELWYDSLYLVEPFAASCGADNTFWEEHLPYDTSFHVWESGLTGFVPTIDDLRERPPEKYTFVKRRDSIITFWALQYGLKKGDSTRIEWLKPNGDLWFEFNYVYDKDYWFFYYYSYIYVPPPVLAGTWTYNYYYNDKLVVTGNFTVQKPSGVTGVENNSYYRIIDKSHLEVVLDDSIKAKEVEVYNITGQRLVTKKTGGKNKFILKIPVQENPAVYLISVKHSGGLWNFKVVL